MHIFKTMTLGQIKDIIKIYRDHNKSDPQCCHNINLNQLREIYNDGLVAIGAHTSSHPILANEDNITCKNEIIGSINGLNRILGYSVKYFAYPNGIPDLDFGEREKEILRNSGCKLAFSTVHESIDKKYDPLSLPRYYISKGSVTSIRTKLILGRYWHAVKSIKSKSEEKARAELKRILKLEEISSISPAVDIDN